ncbi:MAG: hypothetical protein ISS43_03835 [Candidatus Omnitrophica bacterium]|nr:hypothetical protein [Candidatus Omnitrophota bacterium]
MNAIYDTLEVDRNEHTVDKGVVALFVFYTSFYEQVQEECRPELAEALMDKCLKVPCIKIVKDTVLEKEGE